MVLDKTKKFLGVFSLFIPILILGFSLVAQGQTITGYTPQISISPANPSYGQQVTATVEMTAVNLESATMLWQVNGVTKKEGVAEKAFTFQTEKSGRTSLVRVVITDLNGTSYENIYEVAPSEVDLIIEPGSFIPPFYSGRSAFAVQGTARIVAITNILADGVRVSNNNLTFKWKKNGVVSSEGSGKGKNTFEVNGSVPIKDIYVDVEVYDARAKLVGSNSTIITPYNTNVVLYEDNALYGKLFNSALTGTKNIGTQEEFSVLAYPLYFNVADATSNALDYKWYVGGSKSSTEGDVNTLLLRQTGAKGSTSISLKIDGVSRIFQYGSSGFNLMFGE